MNPQLMNPQLDLKILATKIEPISSTTTGTLNQDIDGHRSLQQRQYGGS
jgi:hypothetical protein